MATVEVTDEMLYMSAPNGERITTVLDCFGTEWHRVNNNVWCHSIETQTLTTMERLRIIFGPITAEVRNADGSK